MSGANTDLEIGEDEIRDSLYAVTNGQALSAAPRMAEFLTYIVGEHLAGRGDRIKATTIAMDVYGRAADQSANLVRVDAGRLRRLLTDYYAGDGANDPVQIEVPKGGYTPHFTRHSAAPSLPSTGQEPPTPRPWLRRVVVLAAIVALGAISLWWAMPSPQPDTTASQADLARQATFEANPAKLKSATLTQDAKELLFPSFDPVRLQTSQALYEQALRFDPSNADAMAGLGISKSMAGYLAPPSDQRDALIEDGLTHSLAAVDLAPDQGWPHIAKGWSLFVAGQRKEARASASLARKLSPQDDAIQDFQALILLFSGNFQEATKASDVNLSGLPYGSRSPRLNVLGAALFHLGDYGGAIRAFNLSASSGAPVSAIATAYLAAAYHANGEVQKARNLGAELRQTWPDARIRPLAAQLFFGTEYLGPLYQHLSGAGIE